MTAPRILRIRSRGRDVRAVQRALRKAGVHLGGGKFTNLFHDAMVNEVQEFQTAHGLEADGEVGDQSYTPLEPFFDAFGRSLLAAVTKELASPTGVRQRIVAADVGVRNRDAIHYTQDSRRMQGVREQRRLPRFPEFEDCSSFATWCYWVAGAPDPNGLGYNGFGFTGTQITHGTVTSDPRPSDLVFYGPGSVPKHVTVYVGNGWVVSHGGEQGPLLPRSTTARTASRSGRTCPERPANGEEPPHPCLSPAERYHSLAMRRYSRSAFGRTPRLRLDDDGAVHAGGDVSVIFTS